MKILLEKERSQVIEVSMVSDSRVRKVIKRYSSLLDTDGYYREDYGRICNEISIMKNSSHPHVMKIDFAIHSQSDNSLLICMPLCSRGTLSDQIHAGLDAYQIGVYFIEIACGLRYLHDKRFIHGDVKPGNVFVNASNNAILADFGSSFILPAGQDYVTTWGGTRGYIGPEFVNSHTPVNAFKVSSLMFKKGYLLHQLQNSRVIGAFSQSSSFVFDHIIIVNRLNTLEIKSKFFSQILTIYSSTIYLFLTMIIYYIR